MLPVFDNFWINYNKIKMKYLEKIEKFKLVDTGFSSHQRE